MVDHTRAIGAKAAQTRASGGGRAGGFRDPLRRKKKTRASERTRVQRREDHTLKRSMGGRKRLKATTLKREGEAKEL